MRCSCMRLHSASEGKNKMNSINYEDLLIDEYLYEQDIYNVYYDRLKEQQKQLIEGQINLFVQWLDLVTASDFGDDDGLSGVFVPTGRK